MITDHMTMVARPGDHLDTTRRPPARHTDQISARTLAIATITAAEER